MTTPLVNLILGIIFGASLVLAGFAEPDRIIKALRLREMRVIRSVIIIFLAVLIGTFIIKILGTVETGNKSAAIVTLVIGGLLFGAGTGFTGYTPVTCMAGAACGKVDALFTILGMFFGGYVYVFLYPPAIQPLEIIYNYGKVTLTEITHIPDIIWIIFFSAACLIGLFLTWIKELILKSPNIESDLPVKKVNVYEEYTPELLTNEKSISTNLDSYETTQMLRLWKNIFFIIIILCMLLLQIFFWLVSQQSNNNPPVIFGLTPEYIITILNVSNTVLIFSAFLYLLSIFFCLSISFSSNFGGLKYISRSFFSALIALVLLLPWHLLFGRILFGVIYSPSELFTMTNQDIPVVMLYFRFVGYWAFVILILIRSQIYSNKWAKTLFERIDQII